MFSIYRELHPPTSIENAVECYFFNKKEKNIVITSINELFVYRVFNEKKECKTSKLDCLASYKLFGSVVSVECISSKNAPSDLLFLSFKEAKASLVCYDSDNHDLKTLSLHNYEYEEFKGGRSNTEYFLPLLRKDARNRCAGMLVYGRHLVLFTFHHEFFNADLSDKSTDEAENKERKKSRQFCTSESFDMNHLDERIVTMTDFNFLHGYCQPTLVVLFEHLPTCTSRLAIKKDTYNLLIVTINPSPQNKLSNKDALPSIKHEDNDEEDEEENESDEDDDEEEDDDEDEATDLMFLRNTYNRKRKRRALTRRPTVSKVFFKDTSKSIHPTVIWHYNNLPFDAKRVIPVTHAIGGFLLVCTNSLIYLKQGMPSYAVALNSIAHNTTELPLEEQDDMKITLDCSTFCFIHPLTLLFSLRTGEIYVVTIVLDKLNSIRKFHFSRAASSVVTTCLCSVEDDHLFVGSRLGNSLLLKYYEKELEAIADIDNDDKNNADKSGTKGVVFSSGDVNDNVENNINKDTSNNMHESRSNDENCPEDKPVVDSSTDAGEKVDDGGNKNGIDEKDDNDGNNEDKEASVNNTESISKNLSINSAASDVIDKCSKKENEEEEEEEEEVDELYEGEKVFEETKLCQYTFEVKDKLINIAPCTSWVFGEALGLPEEFQENTKNLELAVATGCLRNGAVSVMQRTIKPHLVTTFELPDCVDMWTIVNQQSEEINEAHSEDTDVHSLLFLSKTDSTMVLSTGQEIMEVEQSSFVTTSATVYAGNILHNSLIVQVVPHAIKLLAGLSEMDEAALPRPAVECSVAGEYIGICDGGGKVSLFTVEPSTSIGAFKFQQITLPTSIEEIEATAICLYKDDTCMFTCGSDDVTSLALPTNSTLEEDCLYEEEKDEDKHQGTRGDMTQETAIDTHWLFVCGVDGVLQVYQVPDMTLVFMTRDLLTHKKLLCHQTDAEEDAKFMKDLSFPAEEICVVGTASGKVHLMVITNHQLLIYEAFKYIDNKNNNNSNNNANHDLKIRFKRISHELIANLPADYKNNNNNNLNNKNNNIKRRQLREFKNISGMDGVFMCGERSKWLLEGRGGVLSHQMNVDGAVKSFAHFNNVNCHAGFLYFNDKNELRISLLASNTHYDTFWPCRKVALRSTPHHIIYHYDAKLYAVIQSSQKVCKKLIKVYGDNEKDIEEVEKDDRFIYPTSDSYQLLLYSPVTWQVVPQSAFVFDEFELVTSMKLVSLKSDLSVDGFKSYIAIGTTYTYTEGYACRGRILIFNVVEVVPQPGAPLTKNKLKAEYQREQKGPVSVVDCVCGHLVSAIHSKIYVWQLKDNDLRGVAFIDAAIYIQSICVLKNFLLVADCTKSITLLRYQEEMKVLSFVSRDAKLKKVYALGYFVNNQVLGFIMADSNNNLSIYSYLPEVKDSNGGQQLICLAGINLGSRATNMQRLRCSTGFLNTSDNSAVMNPLLDKTHVTYLTTSEGAIGCILPLSEKVYRRLLTLQNILNSLLRHYAGLNPKTYRSLRTYHKYLASTHRKVVLDERLIKNYFTLDLSQRHDIAKRMGTSVQQITSDLYEIELVTSHF